MRYLSLTQHHAETCRDELPFSGSPESINKILSTDYEKLRLGKPYRAKNISIPTAGSHKSGFRVSSTTKRVSDITSSGYSDSRK